MRDQLDKRLEDDRDPLADALSDIERRFLRCQLDVAGLNDAQMPWFLELHEETGKAVEGRRTAGLRRFAGPPKRKRGRKTKDPHAMLREWLAGAKLKKIRKDHGVSSIDQVWKYIRKAAKVEGVEVERPKPLE